MCMSALRHQLSFQKWLQAIKQTHKAIVWKHPYEIRVLRKCRNCGHMPDPFLYLKKSLSVGWKNSYLGGTFLGGWGDGRPNPYDGRRHSKYRSLLLINGCDKKMKLMGGDTKV